MLLLLLPPQWYHGFHGNQSRQQHQLNQREINVNCYLDWVSDAGVSIHWHGTHVHDWWGTHRYINHLPGGTKAQTERPVTCTIIIIIIITLSQIYRGNGYCFRSISGAHPENCFERGTLDFEAILPSQLVGLGQRHKVPSGVWGEAPQPLIIFGHYIRNFVLFHAFVLLHFAI